MILVSIIICSDGKRDTILDTIYSLLKQRYIGDVETEIIIVDNSRSRSVIECVSKLKNAPFIKKVHEERRGHSNALNRGISIASGELVLFIDDDAIADPDWAQSYINAHDVGKRVGYLFGPIITAWSRDTNKKGILPRSLGGFFIDKDIVDFNFACRNGLPVGVNMALTRDVIQSGIIFDSRLGPGSLFGMYYGADVLIAKEILDAGFIGKYVRKAGIFHCVPKERITFYSLLKRKYFVGRSAYVYDNVDIGFIGYLAVTLKELLLIFLFTIVGRTFRAKKTSLIFIRRVGYLRSMMLFRRNN